MTNQNLGIGEVTWSKKINKKTPSTKSFAALVLGLETSRQSARLNRGCFFYLIILASQPR